SASTTGLSLTDNNWSLSAAGAFASDATGTAITLSGAGTAIGFTGAGLAQITTASNQSLALMPGGTGNVGINTTTTLATLDVRGNTATTPAASVSANSNFAAMVVDNTGSGDLFTASKSGATKFRIAKSGNIAIGGTSVEDPYGKITLIRPDQNS